MLARRPLRDHQDGDVRARDEERQQDCGAEHVGQQEGHLVADWRAFESGRPHGQLSLAGREVLRVVGQAALELGVERGVRRAGRTPHDDADSRVWWQGPGIERDPDRRVHVREPEALRHHADDGMGFVVYREDAPDRVSVLVEELMPHPMAEDHGRRTADGCGRGGEGSAVRWCDAEDRRRAPASRLGVGTLAVRSPVRISRTPSDVYAAIDGPIVSRQR